MGATTIGTVFTGALNDGQSAYLSSGKSNFINQAQTYLNAATAAVSTYDAIVQLGGDELPFGLNAVAIKANIGLNKLQHKFLTVFFVLVFVALQIYSPAYANNADDKALISAVMKGDDVMAKRLLTAGAKVDTVNKFGSNPIHIAVQNDGIEMVKVLLAAGAKADAVDKEGIQPIHYAALKGNIVMVQILLAAGAKVDARVMNSQVEKIGAQPLHFAARSGNAELVKMLIMDGANVNAKDSNGDTPLSYILIKGIGDPVLVKKELLAAGATNRPNIIDSKIPKWLEIGEPQIRLGVYDQNNVKENFIAKYIVKCENGAMFSVEKAVISSHPDSSEVSFPKDFHDATKGQESRQAYGCYGKHGQNLTWAIYADDILIDSGTMTFTRSFSQ
jgi:hypothetical protein